MKPQSQCWRWRARGPAALTAMAAALLATACGGSPSSTGSGAAPGGGSAVSASAVAYSRCMRSHGVPEYPDPNSSGQLPKLTPSDQQQLGVSATRFNAAQGACQALWPYQGPTQAEQRQNLFYALKFARCMRSRGLPNFPDPTTSSSSGHAEFIFNIRQEGFDPRTPKILAKVRVCEHVVPAVMRLGGSDAIEARIRP